MSNTDFLTRIAVTAYEAARAWRDQNEQGEGTPWDDLDSSDQEQVRQDVQFFIDRPYLGAAALHQHWCDVMKEKGWTYGSVLDADAKQDPLLMTFGQLTPQQQQVMNLRRAVITTLSKP